MSNQTSTSLLDTNEAAPFLGCSPVTLRCSRTSGKLLGKAAPAFIKIGRSVRYKRETLEAWLNQFEEISTKSA